VKHSDPGPHRSVTPAGAEVGTRAGASNRSPLAQNDAESGRGMGGARRACLASALRLVAGVAPLS